MTSAMSRAKQRWPRSWDAYPPHATGGTAKRSDRSKAPTRGQGPSHTEHQRRELQSLRDQTASLRHTLQQLQHPSLKAEASRQKKPKPKPNRSSLGSHPGVMGERGKAPRALRKEGGKHSHARLSRLLIPPAVSTEMKTTTTVYESRADVLAPPGAPQLVFLGHLGRSPSALFRIFRGPNMGLKPVSQLVTYDSHPLSEDNKFYWNRASSTWVEVPSTGYADGAHATDVYPDVAEGTYGRVGGGFLEVYATVPEGVQVTVLAKMLDEDETAPTVKLKDILVYDPHHGGQRHRFTSPGRHRIVLPYVMRDKYQAARFEGINAAGYVYPSSAGYYDWLVWTDEVYHSVASVTSGGTVVNSSLPLRIEAILRHSVQYIATGHHIDPPGIGKPVEHKHIESHSFAQEAGKAGAEVALGAAAATAIPRLGGTLSSLAGRAGVWLGDAVAGAGAAAVEAAVGAAEGIELAAPILALGAPIGV